MIRKLILFLLVSLITFSSASTALLALSPDQRRIFRSGISYYNVEDNIQRCSNDAVSLIGNDNIEKIYNYFISKGLSLEQAAGIAGNAMQESGGDPTLVSRSGNYEGIFQWGKVIEGSPGRWVSLVEWAEQQNRDPYDLGTQLDFSWYEANRRTTRYYDGETNVEGMLRQPSVDLAAWYWGRYFEGAVIGGSASHTPLTNVQDLDNRIRYAEEILTSYQVTPGGTPISSTNNCIGGNGQNTQYIDGFTIYSQYDPAWKDLPYSISTIGIAGCGPAAMAMIITNITKQNVTPVETANYAASIDMYVPGAGSKWEIGPRLAEQWGLRSEPIQKNVSAITAALREGKLVITPGAGPKPFTSGGHFIVIRGITADGKFRVGDSGHSDTSDKDWDPQFIVDNMRDGGIYAIFQ
jgi:hypothetical protein